MARKDDIHKQRVKALRPYLDKASPLKGIDLRRNSNTYTPYQKRRIKNAYDALRTAQSTPSVFHRTRTKGNKRKVQASGVHDKFNSDFAGGFIPAPSGGNKVRVRYNKRGGISVTSGGITRTIIPLDKKSLATNVEKAVLTALDGRRFERYGITVGAFDVLGEIYSEVGALITGIRRLTNAYVTWKEWLNAITGYSLKNQATFEEYVKRRNRSGAENKKRKRRKKTRAK